MSEAVESPIVDTSTRHAIETFDTLVRGYTNTGSSALEELRTKLTTIRSAVPDVFDPIRIEKVMKSRASATGVLLQQYMVAKLSAKMPFIRPELFKLKRHIRVALIDPQGTPKVRIVEDELVSPPPTANAGNIHSFHNFEVPLFAYTKMLACEEVVIANSSVNFTGVNSYRERSEKTISFSLRAKLPGIIGVNLRRAYGEALSFYHAVLSEMLTDDLVSEAILTHTQPVPEIGAIWIPTMSSFNLTCDVEERIIKPPERYDPAMILKLGESNFLVCTWDVDGEEPFEKYLREFTATYVKKPN